MTSKTPSHNDALPSNGAKSSLERAAQRRLISTRARPLSSPTAEIVHSPVEDFISGDDKTLCTLSACKICTNYVKTHVDNKFLPIRTKKTTVHEESDNQLVKTIITDSEGEVRAEIATRPESSHTVEDSSGIRIPEIRHVRSSALLPELVVCLGLTQILYDPRRKVAATIIEIKTWTKYINQDLKNGIYHPDYEYFKKLRKQKKEELMTTHVINDQRIWSHGPYHCVFRIDGVRIATKAYVTEDPLFKENLTLSNSVWTKREIKMVCARDSNDSMDSTSEADKEIIHSITENGRTKLTINGIEVAALVDTGAGPSLITMTKYVALGGHVDDIIPSNARLIAANDTVIPSLGQTIPVRFSIDETVYEWSFLIVEYLGKDSLLLGRDFLKHYDISINLSEGTMQAGATMEDRPLRVVNNIQEERIRLVANCQNSIEIPPGEICCVELTIQRKRGDSLNDNDNSPWLAYAQGRATEERSMRGLCVAHSITKVEGDKLIVPILNMNLEEAKKVNPRDFTIIIHRVEVTYEREGDHSDKPGFEGSMDDSQEIMKIKQDKENDIGEDSKEGSETLRSATNFPLDLRSGQIPITEVDPKFPPKPDLTRIGKELSESQKNELDELMLRYRGIFSKNARDIGKTHLVTHDIEVEPGVKPFRETLRRMAPDKRDITRSQIAQMIEMGIIVPSHSPYASAVVLAKRADGRFRFCVDFRKLNEITIKDAYPLPRLDEELKSVSAARYFTTLEMGSAAWQIPLSEDAKPKTAFVADGGFYQYETMAFGLSNTTYTFQKLMSKALSTITNRYGNLVLCYVEDILIATKTVDEHFQRLREVFDCLQRAGLKLKAAKCNIMSRKVTFLGRTIDQDGVRPDPEAIETIRNWKDPIDKTTLHSFMDLANYYREFIFHYSDLVAPLNLIDRKGKTFEWGELQRTAFAAVKLALMSAPILALPTGNGDYVLDTDASAVAISGILQQWQVIEGKDKLCVISYGSRALRNSERSYGAPKAEMLAVVTYIDRYRSLLGTKEFLLRTDCQALRWLKTWSMGEGAIAQWITRISRSHFRYEHRLRRYHTNADGLTKKTQYHDVGEPAPRIAKGLPFMRKDQFDALIPLEDAEPPCAVALAKKLTPLAKEQEQIMVIGFIQDEIKIRTGQRSEREDAISYDSDDSSHINIAFSLHDKLNTVENEAKDKNNDMEVIKVVTTVTDINTGTQTDKAIPEEVMLHIQEEKDDIWKTWQPQRIDNLKKPRKEEPMRIMFTGATWPKNAMKFSKMSDTDEEPIHEKEEKRTEDEDARYDNILENLWRTKLEPRECDPKTDLEIGPRERIEKTNPVPTFARSKAGTMVDDFLPAYCDRIYYQKGDIFDSVHSKAHCVSADLNMSKGVARGFRLKYQHLSTLFNQNCIVGDVAILTPKQTGHEEEYIFYMVTKVRYFEKPTLETMEMAIDRVIRDVTALRVKTLSIPMIGAGLDKLKWSDVYNLLARRLARIPINEELNIIVHYINKDLDNKFIQVQLPILRVDFDKYGDKDVETVPRECNKVDDDCNEADVTISYYGSDHEEIGLEGSRTSPVHSNHITVNMVDWVDKVVGHDDPSIQVTTLDLAEPSPLWKCLHNESYAKRSMTDEKLRILSKNKNKPNPGSQKG